MNKVELIEAISGKINVAKKEVEDVIETMIETIVAKLQADDEVTLTGFGAFSARTRKGRTGVNPRNPSEKIEIPPVRVPKFKAGKNLKEALKGSKAAKAEEKIEPIEEKAEEAPAAE